MRTDVVNLSENALVTLYNALNPLLLSGDRSVKSLRDELEDEIWQRGLPGRSWLSSLDRSGSLSHE